MRGRREQGNKTSNKLITSVIVIVVVGLCIFFNIRMKDIREQNAADAKEIEKLQEELESEQDRAEELEEYSKYVNTKQFVEEFARDKLGLIYPDEIIFKSGE